ncbi:Thiol:disulfide interchange protein DsbA [Candidatus Sulfopaludibacter sp. SbA4]|nr:Thiol:disulfide interchange protein DsbA [Candidatus Sulfopaludibacter sp. SbA4]
MINRTNKNHVAGMILGVTLFALTPAAGWGQSSEQEIAALRAEVQQLKQGQQAMQNDIAAIKQSLAPKAPAPFQGADVPLSGDAVLGSKDARVTLVEFVDYQCPFCQLNFKDTLPRLIKEYVDTGKVRYVAHDFPLVTIHSNALNAAAAARCAGEQGKYWEMHDELFANQRALDAQSLPSYARQIGLDAGVFQTCVDNGAEAAKVREDLETGQKIGITGTPGFLLGLTDPKDPSLLKATKKISGAQAYNIFKAAIDSLLETAEQAANLHEKALQ